MEMTSEEREELTRLTAYWRKVKWGAQQAMLHMANERLANAGNYNMRITTDVVRKLAADFLHVKLDAWIRYTSQRRARQKKLDRARKMLQRLAMKTIAHTWHGWSLEQVVQRAKVKRALGRLSSKLLGRAFRGWVVQHVAQGRREQAVKTARQKILLSRVIGAYAAWAGLNRHVRVRKFKVACSLRRIHRNLKRHVWHEWAQVAHAEASERKELAQNKAAQVAAEAQAAHVAEVAATKEAARATRIVREVRARARARGLRNALMALEENGYTAPRERSKWKRGVGFHRKGLLQWAWAWIVQNATRRARRSDRLQHARTLMQHSTMRRCLYRLAALPARLRAEEAHQKETAAHNTRLEASEAEVMRLGIDNRRLQRKMRMMEDETVDNAAAEGERHAETNDGLAVPRLKIPGSTPRSTRSSHIETPRSARSTRRSSARSLQSNPSGQSSTPRSRQTKQPGDRASGLEAELYRLNRKVGNLAEREGHILAMLVNYCEAGDKSSDGALAATPRGSNLETKAAAAVSRGADAVAAMEQRRTSCRPKQTDGISRRQGVATMLPAGIAPWKGRNEHSSTNSSSYYTSSNRTQQLVRYPADFNQLVKTLHKKPNAGVGLQVEEMAYSSLYIHTHVSTVAQTEEATSERPIKTTTTTHIYAEDVSRTQAFLSTSGSPTDMEKVAPPVRSKGQKRRRLQPGRQRGKATSLDTANYEVIAAKQQAAATAKLSELQPRGMHRLTAAMEKIKIVPAGRRM